MKSISKSSSTKILDDISAIQEEFYSSNKKNVFFTSSQKKECADFVNSKLSLDNLIKNTIYIVSPNLLFVDYTLLKQYASTKNYEEILNYIFYSIQKIIEECNEYELHINFQGFSVSAVERYKELIQSFYKKFFQVNQENINYIQHLKFLYIYNVPSMMSTITTILTKYMRETVSQRLSIKDRMIMYSKEESAEKLAKIYGSRIGDENV